MNNFEWCVYTYQHRKAFVYVANRLIQDPELREHILKRGKVHDMDKLLLYQFLSWQECVDYHIKHQSHHLESGKVNTYEDLLEMIIDYECAPYTKPDKPLNAFDFVHKLVEWDKIDDVFADRLYAIMHVLGIDHSYDITKEQQCIDFVNSLEDVTEEKILLEIMEYVHENPCEELQFLHKNLI